jgi:hypothetical protein
VFVEASGTVRLLDFGIARVRELTRERGSTEMGAIMGTPSFMPPEQARGRWDEVDARSDLWALGATMYTLLTGERVRSAQTLNEELLLAMTKPVPPLRRALPGVDAAIGRVIDKALAMERTERFASADEMLRALDASAVRSGRVRGRWGLVAVALLTSAGVAMVAVSETRGAAIVRDDAPRHKADHASRGAEAPASEERLVGNVAADPGPPVVTRHADARGAPSLPTTTSAPAHVDPLPPSTPAPARPVLDRRR